MWKRDILFLTERVPLILEWIQPSQDSSHLLCDNVDNSNMASNKQKFNSLDSHPSRMAYQTIIRSLPGILRYYAFHLWENKLLYYNFEMYEDVSQAHYSKNIYYCLTVIQ